VSPFSTSIARLAPAGETDAELVAKLESEIQFEEEVKENEQLPVSIQDFLDNSPFEIEDIPGKEEVKLVRSFGDEKYVHNKLLNPQNYCLKSSE
jgi:complement component 1 Q subcomponent-binding protein, mitochondrial